MINVSDRGPWRVMVDEKGIPSIASDDFTHDVVLRITGDFEDNIMRKAYAQDLCDSLNSTLSVH